MSTETHTVQTAYGETEIETCECDSCGTRVAYDNTVPFRIGDTEGRACEHCEETGPISFPKRVVTWSLPADVHDDGERYGLWFHISLAPLLTPFVLMDGLTDTYDDNGFQQGVTTGMLMVLTWIGLAAVVIGVLL